MTSYTVETVGGDELEAHKTLSDAVGAAVRRLEDDPELGELHVFEIGRTAPMGAYLKTIPTHEHVKTITHAPDAHWNTEIVVLDSNERIQPPSVFRCNPDESGGYALTDPKHERHHEVMSEVWDNREKT